MKLSQTFPSAPAPDANDIETLSARLLALADKLAAQVPALGRAKTVREMHDERRKRALALQMREHLATGDSAAAADVKARASVAYGEALEGFAVQLESAETIIAETDATRALFEACRTCLSALKSIAGNLA